jgi:hypothetical protein
MRRSQGRPEELAALVERAKAGLRDWTDSQEHDPGIALLELFAFLAETLSAYADQLAEEAYLGAGRPVSGLEVEVDGERWRAVASLAESGADDPHFTTTVRDDGATVVEFGDGEHGRLPPTGGGLRLRYRYGARYAAVEMQQGRVVLDADHNAQPAQTVYGIYRAHVVNNVDPMGQGRLLVQVPDVTGLTTSTWAVRCLPAGESGNLPSIGDTVWVMYEAGNIDHPVWLGRLPSA